MEHASKKHIGKISIYCSGKTPRRAGHQSAARVGEPQGSSVRGGGSGGGRRSRTAWLPAGRTRECPSHRGQVAVPGRRGPGLDTWLSLNRPHSIIRGKLDGAPGNMIYHPTSEPLACPTRRGEGGRQLRGGRGPGLTARAAGECPVPGNTRPRDRALGAAGALTGWELALSPQRWWISVRGHSWLKFMYAVIWIIFLSFFRNLKNKI